MTALVMGEDGILRLTDRRPEGGGGAATSVQGKWDDVIDKHNLLLWQKNTKKVTSSGTDLRDQRRTNILRS